MSNDKRIRVSENGIIHIDLGGMVRDILRRTREGIEAAMIARGERRVVYKTALSPEEVEARVMRFIERRLKRFSVVQMRDIAQVPLREMNSEERHHIMEGLVAKGLLVEGESSNVRGPKAPVYVLPGTASDVFPEVCVPLA